jgi:two-component system, OmpR family, response regulator CpxR
MVAVSDSAEERIANLDAGADDCLGRPFHPGELVARVRALLRRQGDGNDALPPLEANGVRLVHASREVFLDGEPVAITTVEFEILSVLMRSAGVPVSRDQLMEVLYHRKATAFDRSIDMHVSHLRRKLSSNRVLIKTVRGAGYQFCLAAKGSTA